LAWRRISNLLSLPTVKSLKFLTVVTLNRANLRHLAKFRLNRSNRGRNMTIFRFFQDGERCHLGCLKFESFNGWRLNRPNCVAMPNLIEIGQTAAAIWRFFDFSKMAAVHHLGFVLRVFGPPTKGIWWSLLLCKISLESKQQF